MTPVVVYLPLRLVSVANLREHWRVARKRVQEQRAVARMALAPRLPPAGRVDSMGHRLEAHPVLPCTVTLMRIGKRKLDGDNLQSACKAVRDGVADALGVDDADPRVTWAYSQSVAKAYGVRVEIAARPT